MTSIFAALITVATIGLTLIQSILVIGYRRFLLDRKLDSREPMNAAVDSSLPKAAVILCLRGNDESLAECLTGIIGQDYPSYEIHTVFDSHDDPAVATVRDFFADRETLVHMHFFEPLPNCSYKNAAICHVVNQLDPTIEAIALCDADAIIDQNWLHDLITGLKDPEVGATTGNRWFSPLEPLAGSLFRKYWNSAAIVQMQAYNIAWGGSLAIRRKVIDECNLLEKWSQAFCEDTMLSRILSSHGYRTRRLPQLVVENHESTSVRDSLHWITRQLLTVRLHHPDWILVLAHGVFSAIATWIAPIATILFLLLGNFEAARATGVAFFVYQIVNFLLLWVIEFNNNAVLRDRESFNRIEPASIDRGALLDHLKAVALTQILYPIAVVKAALATDTSWRGVRYDFGDGQIRVKEVQATQAGTRQNGIRTVKQTEPPQSPPPSPIRSLEENGAESNHRD